MTAVTTYDYDDALCIQDAVNRATVLSCYDVNQGVTGNCRTHVVTTAHYRHSYDYDDGNSVVTDADGLYYYGLRSYSAPH